MGSRGAFADVNTGNFIIYNNEIKVIDFEPGHIHFSDKYKKYMTQALSKYASLVDIICWKYRFKKVNFKSGEDFYSTEQNVLALRKRLER